MDPDAPSPDNPKLRHFMHWIVANIPGVDVQRGDVIMDYMGPVCYTLIWNAFTWARLGLLYPCEGAMLACKHLGLMVKCRKHTGRW